MLPQCKGIVFDMDGTLTVPMLDFALIRQELDISEGDIVTVINSWPENRKKKAWKLIEKHEDELAEKNQLQPGVAETLLKFRRNGIRLGIITRNTRESVGKLLARFSLFLFDPILTREFPYLKPAPEPVRYILEQWRIMPDECLVVGDYIHDLESARAAGAVSCFYHNRKGTDFSGAADYTVYSYSELEALILS